MKTWRSLWFVGVALICGCQSVEVRKVPITLHPTQVDPKSGKVTINGADPNQPHRPFSWNWGDGHTEIGWFPLTHIYEDTSRDYVLIVTAYYDDGQTGKVGAVVSFKKKTPDQALAPTPPSATPPAHAGVAPPDGAAHP